MTKEELAAIHSRLDAATPDNWATDGACFANCCATAAEREVAKHALTDLRALLDEVERLDSKVKKLEEELAITERRMRWDAIDRRSDRIVDFK
jgi:hypothetical protein